MSEHIKTELEIIESYLKWKEFYERNEMPKDIEKAVYDKAETKWVSLFWIKEQVERNQPFISSKVKPYCDGVDDALKWVLSLLEKS